MTEDTKIYSNSFAVNTCGSMVMEIQAAIQDLRNQGFTINYKSQTIREYGFLFKKTLIENDITISGTDKSSIDNISKNLQNTYDTILLRR